MSGDSGRRYERGSTQGIKARAAVWLGAVHRTLWSRSRGLEERQALHQGSPELGQGVDHHRFRWSGRPSAGEGRDSTEHGDQEEDAGTAGEASRH